MIKSLQLSTNIINKINKKTDHESVHNIIINQVQTYIQQNLQVLCSYSGVIPTTGITDPLSGIYTFKMLNCNIITDMLMNTAKNGLNAWYSQLLYQIKLYTILNTTNGTVSIYSPIPIISTINKTQLDIKSLDFEQSWYKLINTFHNDIIMSSPFIPPVPAFSNSGGVGFITFTKFN